MAPTARNIYTCAVFTTSYFNFGIPTYFVSHCYGKRVFQKKVEQSCLTVVWQMTCQRSHICWCASCRHLVFVLFRSFCLGSFKNKFCLASPETGVSLSFKKTTANINLLEYFFLEIDVYVVLFVDLIHYLTFSHHTIQDSHT